MVDLVWVEHVDGSKSPVNPARVQYLRLTNTRDTARAPLSLAHPPTVDRPNPHPRPDPIG